MPYGWMVYLKSVPNRKHSYDHRPPTTNLATCDILAGPFCAKFFSDIFASCTVFVSPQGALIFVCCGTVIIRPSLLWWRHIGRYRGCHFALAFCGSD